MPRHKLPSEVRYLVHARNQLRTRYGHLGLKFTPDGNLVGDLGEAVASELFGLRLAERRGLKAIDAYAPGRETVQIKASGRGRAVQFTHSEEPANWLLVLVFDYEAEEVDVVYNGRYRPAISLLPQAWAGQKPVAVRHLRKLDADLAEADRLPYRN